MRNGKTAVWLVLKEVQHKHTHETQMHVSHLRHEPNRAAFVMLWCGHRTVAAHLQPKPRSLSPPQPTKSKRNKKANVAHLCDEEDVGQKRNAIIRNIIDQINEENPGQGMEGWKSKTNSVGGDWPGQLNGLSG